MIIDELEFIRKMKTQEKAICQSPEIKSVIIEKDDFLRLMTYLPMQETFNDHNH